MNTLTEKKSPSHTLDIRGQILCTNLEQKEYWMGTTGSSSLCLLSYCTLAEPWELVWHLGDISPSLRRKKIKKCKTIRCCPTQNLVCTRGYNGEKRQQVEKTEWQIQVFLK